MLRDSNTAILNGFVGGIAGVAIVLMFALHPGVHLYHVGFAGYLVASVFVIATISGAAIPRAWTLSAVIVLAFVEPDTFITNSLRFNVASNGILVGAAINWIINRPRVDRRDIYLLLPIATLSLMALTLPFVFGSSGWIHVHDSMMFAKYGLIMILAFSVRSDRHRWRAVAIPVVIGSGLAAMYTLVQAFHIPAINHWTFTTYFASRNWTDIEINHFAQEYYRVWGVDKPVATAALLSLSVGAWCALLFACRGKLANVALASGLAIVLTAIFLTGSRMGMLTALLGLGLVAVWWLKLGKPPVRMNVVGISVLACASLLWVSAAISPDFNRTFQTSTDRILTTIPGLINRTPDPSIAERLEEYDTLEFSYFGDPTNRNNGSISEYVAFLRRFGMVGLMVVMSLWLILINRVARAAAFAADPRDRLIGMMSSIAVMSAFLSGIGVQSLLSPPTIAVVFSVAGVAAVIPLSATQRTTRAVAAVGVLEWSNKVRGGGLGFEAGERRAA